MSTAEVVEIPQKKLWLAAIKPPIYSVAILPIIVGAAVAFWEEQVFAINIFITFLIGAILILAWLNLSNDVFDAETGIDKNKAHSVVNLTGQKNAVFWLSNFCLLLGILAIVAICWWQEDWMTLILIAIASSLGYIYQGPPFRLGYQGLGEILCFIAFTISTVAGYYAQAQSFSLSSVAAATVVGLTTSIILFCSHFHQVEDDLAAGKKSPIVRLGTKRGWQVLSGSCFAVFLLILLYTSLDLFPWQALISFASLPFAYKLIGHVGAYYDVPEKVSNCKFIAVYLHFSSGLLLALGFLF